MDRGQLLRLVIALLALLGLVMSLYLLKTHFEEPQHRFCDLNETFSCDTVNQSQYAELFGIPVSLLGALHYLLLIVVIAAAPLLATLLRMELRLLYLLLLFELSLGLLFSLYLTWIEAFVLTVYCPICLASAAITLLHFLFVLRLWRRTPFSS